MCMNLQHTAQRLTPKGPFHSRDMCYRSVTSHRGARNSTYCQRYATPTHTKAQLDWSWSDSDDKRTIHVVPSTLLASWWEINRMIKYRRHNNQLASVSPTKSSEFVGFRWTAESCPNAYCGSLIWKEMIKLQQNDLYSLSPAGPRHVRNNPLRPLTTTPVAEVLPVQFAIK